MRQVLVLSIIINMLLFHLCVSRNSFPSTIFGFVREGTAWGRKAEHRFPASRRPRHAFLLPGVLRPRRPSGENWQAAVRLADLSRHSEATADRPDEGRGEKNKTCGKKSR